MTITALNYKRCICCKPDHDTLYAHFDSENNNIWFYCNKCQRAYGLYQYCTAGGITVKEFLAWNVDFTEANPTEVRKMDFPAWYIPMWDPRATVGIDYLKSRGLEPQGELFYDFDQKAIVLPYYYHGHFVGAQNRFIYPRIKDDGSEQKVDTVPGTRLGLLFWGYNQNGLNSEVNTVVVTEGAFNAMSLDQSFKTLFKQNGKTNNFKFMATSGCNLSNHQADVLKELKDTGYKVILAYDPDLSGRKGLEKAIRKECITHYSFFDENKDGNDILKEHGPKELVRAFLKGVRNV